MSYSDITFCRHRRILHWINSLPLPGCLFVNALYDLHNGNVLCDIIYMCIMLLANGNEIDVHSSSTLASAQSSKRLCYLLEILARFGVTTNDQDFFALTDCATRVAEGDEQSILAICTLLYRIYTEGKSKQDSRYCAVAEMTHNKALRPCASRESQAAHSTPIKQNSSAPIDSPPDYKRTVLQVSTQIPPQYDAPNTQACKPIERRLQTTRHHNQAHSQNPIQETADIVCKWIRSYSISLQYDPVPWQLSPNMFNNGVVLSQLAARLPGGPSQPKKKSISILHGTHPSPATLAEKKRNLALAVRALKDKNLILGSPCRYNLKFVWETFLIDCNMENVPKSHPCWAYFRRCAKDIWKFLNEIRLRSENIDKQEKGGKGLHVSRTQYNSMLDWIRECGLQIESIEYRSVQDSFWNGKLLCDLIKAHECHFAHHSLLMCNTSPQTLDHIRDNVRHVVAVLIEDKVPLPKSYHTETFIQRAAEGDREALLGILYYIQRYLDSASKQADVKVSAIREKTHLHEDIPALQLLENNGTFENTQFNYDAIVTMDKIDLYPLNSEFAGSEHWRHT